MGSGKGKAKRAQSTTTEPRTGDQNYSLRDTAVIPNLGNEAHRREIEIYARARTRDHKIWVRFEEDKEKMPAPGYTDMKGNIVLANYLPEDSSDADRYLVISGVLEHELCHCRFYDPKVHEKFVEEMKKLQSSGDDDDAKKAAIVGQLQNVILDGNNERKLRSLEPLAFRRISYLNKIFPRIPEKVWGPVDDKAAAPAGTEDEYQRTKTGQMAAAIHAEALPEWTTDGKELDKDVAKVLKECMPIIDKGVHGTSEDTVAATNELYDVLKKNGMLPEVNLIKQYSIGGDAQPGKAGGDPQDGDAQGKPGDEGEDGAGGGKPDEDGDEGPGAGISDEELEKARKAADEEIKGNVDQSEKDEKAARSKGKVDGDSWQGPPNERITSEKTVRVGGGNEYLENRGPLSRYGNQLATQLAELKSAHLDRTRFKKSGRLDSHRLAKVAIGKDTLFYRPGEELKVDLSASVVLDLSGSMSHQRTKLRDASIVAQVAMEKMNIPHEIWGYSGGGGGGCDHYEFKSFARDNARGLGRIGQPGDSVAPGGGSTPTTQAVDFSTARLKQRTEENRVMFVFTDGQPNDERGSIEAVHNAKTKGVTVLGILFEGGESHYYGGNNKDMMERIFGGDYVIIEDMEELPRAIGKRLKRMLKIR